MNFTSHSQDAVFQYGQLAPKSRYISLGLCFNTFDQNTKRLIRITICNKYNTHTESGQHWFGLWLVVYSAPSHYLKQCWVIVNWTLKNNLQCNLNQNTKFFIHENASKNVVHEKAAILSGGGGNKTAAHSIHEFSSNIKRYFIENFINAHSIPMCYICKRVWKLFYILCINNIFQKYHGFVRKSTWLLSEACWFEVYDFYINVI